MFIKPRVCILADVPALFSASRRAISANLSYRTLMDRIRYERRVVNAFAFCRERGPQEKFLRSLQYADFKPVILKPGMDLRDRIALSIIELATSVDVLALCTDDPSYLSIIDYLEDTDRKPKVELWFFDDVCDDMIKGVDEFHKLDSTYGYTSLVGQ
jgi:hypothetical protein